MAIDFFFSCTVTISARNSTLKEGRKVKHVRVRPMILEGSESWLSGVTQSWGCCWPAGSPASHLSASTWVLQPMALDPSEIFPFGFLRICTSETRHGAAHCCGVNNWKWTRGKKNSFNFLHHLKLSFRTRTFEHLFEGSTSSILQATGPMWQGWRSVWEQRTAMYPSPSPSLSYKCTHSVGLEDGTVASTRYPEQGMKGMWSWLMPFQLLVFLEGLTRYSPLTNAPHFFSCLSLPSGFQQEVVSGFIVCFDIRFLYGVGGRCL